MPRHSNIQVRKVTHNRFSDRLLSIATKVNGILWEADADTFEFTYVSPQSVKILGYSPEEWYQNHSFWKDHIHPDDRDRTVAFCHSKTQAMQDHEFEYRMIDSAGNIVWIKDIVSVEENDAGSKVLTGLMIDVTGYHQENIERANIIQKSYQLAGIGHWEFDILQEHLFWSPEVKNLHEVEQTYQPDLKTALEFYPEGLYREAIQEAVNRTIQTGEPYDLELQIITARGNLRWIRTAGDAKWLNDRCVKIYGVTQDITRSKEREKEINKLSRVARETQNIVIITDPDEHIQWVNKAFESVTGYSLNEVIGKNPGQLLQGKNTNGKTVKRIARYLTEKEQFNERILNYTKNGTPYWTQMSVTPIKNKKGEITEFFSIQEVVTEKVKAQKRNEVLLQEIHHRVKNNLAIISGLLTLEMDEFSNDRAKLSFQRSINRIHSIAKVHELLYGNDDLSSLNICQYLEELSAIISRAFDHELKVNIEIDAEHIDMNINEAVPFGMLMNELFTNSFKYAFGGSKGHIYVKIREKASSYQVIYRDNGKGMSEIPDFDKASTLGFTIVSTLLAQLNSEFKIDVDNKFELSFDFEKKERGSHSNL
ncbi:MAG TPA: PAS domain-containing protein [Gracilimonas sp.]|nr:PAS domain-containing protein [Gracilimonas sp.]